jgi:hypothetical protein
MKRNAKTAASTLLGALFACFHAGAQTPAPIDWADPAYCQSDTTNDPALQQFREEVAYVLMRGFPSTYYANVCVYRESAAFPGGASSLVATLDAENEQGLPTQPHPSPTSVTCAATGDIPCKRVRQVQLYLPGTHVEAVRLPSAPTDNSRRVVAIVVDAAE